MLSLLINNTMICNAGQTLYPRAKLQAYDHDLAGTGSSRFHSEPAMSPGSYHFRSLDYRPDGTGTEEARVANLESNTYYSILDDLAGHVVALEYEGLGGFIRPNS